MLNEARYPLAFTVAIGSFWRRNIPLYVCKLTLVLLNTVVEFFLLRKSLYFNCHSYPNWIVYSCKNVFTIFLFLDSKFFMFDVNLNVNWFFTTLNNQFLKERIYFLTFLFSLVLCLFCLLLNDVFFFLIRFFIYSAYQKKLPLNNR